MVTNWKGFGRMITLQVEPSNLPKSSTIRGSRRDRYRHRLDRDRRYEQALQRLAASRKDLGFSKFRLSGLDETAIDAIALGLTAGVVTLTGDFT